MLVLFGLSMTIAMIQLTCVFIVITSFAGYVTNWERLILRIEESNLHLKSQLSAKKVLSRLFRKKKVPGCDPDTESCITTSPEFIQASKGRRRMQLALLITACIWVLIGFLPFLYRDYR